MEKRCSKCKQYKQDDLFSKDKYSKDGLRGWCKGCMAEYAKKPEVMEMKREASKSWREGRKAAFVINDRIEKKLDDKNDLFAKYR